MASMKRFLDERIVKSEVIPLHDTKENITAREKIAFELENY